LPPHADQLWGSHILLSIWVLGALSPGVKWPGCEADHSPAPSAKVKNVWRHSPVCLHGVVLR